eukprot:204899_1
MTSIDINALQSLLPQAVISFALKHCDSPPPLRQAFPTVALFADVSGFTKLSEAFASKGPQGAEELAFYLNRYMEQIVRHIARAGGDVFKFAGDAMLVLWVPPEDLDEEGVKKEIQQMACRAVQTSIAIQNELDCADLTDGVTLSVKIGIGVGKATVLHVGGVYSRVEYFACGIPLMQAFHSEGKATQGDIIVSPDVWSIVSSSFDGDVVADSFVRITRQTVAIRNKSVKASSKSKSAALDVQNCQSLLEKYIPAAVLPYLTRCQNSWSGELRLVTVLFVNVGVNLSNVQNIDNTSLDWIQKVITGIQRSIYKYEGSLNKFLVDDKGSNVIAVFGVPPLAHNDDATRGLLAALKLLRKMRGLGIKCYIGVTSGLVYTGLLGSGTSREYGVLGDAVNLAARLMAKQKKCGVPGVICDTPTQELIPCSAPIRFDPLEPFYVKGKAVQIRAFEPKYTENCLAYAPQSHYFDIAAAAKRPSIENNAGFVLLCESPIGSGKTHYMESVVNSIRKSNKSCASDRIIWASAHHYVNSSSQTIWSVIFGTLLNRTEFTENRSYRQHVKSLFQNSASSNASDLVPYLSLANDVFGTQFLETEKCSNLPEEDRWDKKTECCLSILSEFSVSPHRLILFIDNLQWSVSDDWKITEFVINMINTGLANVFVFLAARPLLSILFRPRFEEPPAQYRRIRSILKTRNQLISLCAWDCVQVTEFMCEYFAVDDVHPCLPHFVYERSGGNPAFVEWICELIGVHITYIEGALSLEMSEKTESSITSEAPLQHPVPIKVHSVLMGYIDRLTPSQVLLLKTAATICMGQGSGSIVFDEESVIDCYPVHDYVDLVEEDLIHLSQVGIIDSIGNLLNYDIFSSAPHFYAHNHQWMHCSTFVTHILDVSIILSPQSKNDDNIVYSRKLLHFFINRLVFYPYDADAGVSWRMKQIIPFNDRNKPIAMRIIKTNILCIENDEYCCRIRAATERIHDLHCTLDESLNRGIMTEEQERATTYPLDAANNKNKLYSFGCGFFRDVIYGLMLLKQRQQLHEKAAKFLAKRWALDAEEDGADETSDDVALKPDSSLFSQFRTNVLNRHKDLALKDDTLRRMGSFYQAAPQAHNGSQQSKTKRLKTISSFYKSIRTKTINDNSRHRVATLSPNFRKQAAPSIFQRIRQSIANN